MSLEEIKWNVTKDEKKAGPWGARGGCGWVEEGGAWSLSGRRHSEAAHVGRRSSQIHRAPVEFAAKTSSPVIFPSPFEI